MGRPYKCPRCSSTETTWKGYRRLKEGKVRLRKCKSCGRKFTSRHTEEIVEVVQDEQPAVQT